MTDVEYQRQRYEKFFRPAYDALMKFYPLTLDNLDGEEWKDIAGYEGYKISSYGRVKSFKRSNPKILRPGCSQSGYLCVGLGRYNRTITERNHRLVAQAFISNTDSKPQVNHLDGCKLNNYVSNLEWCTASENTRHAYNVGLAPSCENHYKAKLTHEQILYIRENPDNLTTVRLAKMFGVIDATIGFIQRGQTWKNVGGIVRKSTGRTFLVEEQKVEIRRLFVKGDSQFGAKPLARRYGVSKGQIRNIVNGK